MPSPEVEQGFRELFRDLAIAWRSLASYPAGHPMVASGLSGALQSIERLLHLTGPIELVATRNALLYGGQRFDEPGPARLASLLRRRRAASLGLFPGVTALELERLLRALAIEPRLAATAPSLARELVEAGVERIVATDLDFSSLVLVEGESGAAEEDLWTRIARRLFRLGELQAEQLDAWIASGGSMAGLLRSMLGTAHGAGGEEAAGDGAERAGAGAGIGSGATESRLVAAAVEAAGEGGGATAGDLAELAGWLSPAGRERLARELEQAYSTRADGGAALAAFFAALPPPLAASMRAASSALSGAARVAVDDPVRLARLRRTLSTADIDILADSSEGPDRSGVLLELAGEESPAPESQRLEGEFESGSIARAVAASLLELAERDETTEAALVNLLAKVEGAYRTLLGAGRVRTALELVERIQRRSRRDDPAAAQFRRCAERLSTRESVGVLAGALSQLPPDAIRVARQLVERLGPTAARHLLGQLAESEDRDQRRRLLDLLADLGPLVVRDATSLLADPRWYVVRNVLLLLRRVGDPGSLPAVRKCAEHGDLRVRLEAIRNLFAFDQELPRELLRQAFEHRDARLAGEAIDLAGEHQMVEAGEMLARLLARWDPFGRRRPARLKAIRALAQIADPAALAPLRKFGARFTLLPVAREEQIAFYRSLASYPPESVAPWIAQGLRSPIPEVRQIAGELRAASEAPA